MIRIGIICPSEIAFRRFMPALEKSSEFEYAGIAYANKEEWFGESAGSVSDKEFAKIKEQEADKAENFRKTYGGNVYDGYENLIQSGRIDAVYIPLPPALHFKWAKCALNNGLHAFLEKPSTTSLKDTTELVELARKKNLALHENYMFIFHSQLQEINDVVKSGAIGEVRLFRIDFGFPERKQSDFRYNKKLGGGALLDCGGYTLKYADYLLGGRSELVCANSLYSDKYEVDIAGSATLKNDNGQVVQVAFGMDNDYRCNIDIWGSEGTLRSGRILTAPEGYEPEYVISKNGKTEVFKLAADDTFLKSINKFYGCIKEESQRESNYESMLHQQKLVDSFIDKTFINGFQNNIKVEDDNLIKGAM